MATGLKSLSTDRATIWSWQVDSMRLPSVHGIFARLGGESRPPYGSLNLGLHTSDDPSLVVRNRRSALNALGLSIEQVVAGEQVHGSEVAEVGASDRGRGSLEYATAVPGVDALITRTKGIALFGYFADCLPVLLCDEDGTWIGLAHAGWKGSVGGVTANTVRNLIENGVEADRVWMALGPCIGPCCYEVGEEVVGAFRTRFGESVITRARSGKPSVDLVAANRIEAVEAGIDPDRITSSGLCTSCRTDLFFSHRAEGPKTGRMAAVIAL